MSLQDLYYIVSVFLFVIGLLVVVMRKNIILILMGVELMLNAANLNFIAFQSSTNSNLQGQLFSLFVLIIAVAEAAVGLAIVIKVVEVFRTSDVDEIQKLKE